MGDVMMLACLLGLVLASYALIAFGQNLMRGD
jgi:hypothetical protein